MPKGAAAPSLSAVTAAAVSPLAIKDVGRTGRWPDGPPVDPLAKPRGGQFAQVPADGVFRDRPFLGQLGRQHPALPFEPLQDQLLALLRERRGERIGWHAAYS